MNEWKKNLRRVTPYTPGEQPRTDNVIKLNTNENPYPPSPLVTQELMSFDTDALRLYPPVDTEPLLGALSEYYGRDKDEIFVGVGSDDVLSVAFLALFNSDKPILFPDITYSFYDVWADLYHIPYERVKLDSQFRPVKEDYCRENGGIVIANPNAPVSLCEKPDFIEYLLKNNSDSIVIVDEAYVDFGGTSAIGLIDRYENLLVVQTFSKSRSLAGLRIGCAFGSKEIISAMNSVKFSINSYTMNLPAIKLGVAALKDEEYFKETVSRIISTRERMTERLRGIGFTVLDSETNFMFISHAEVRAEEIFQKLREKNIYVRYFKKPRIDNYLRVTVGTDEQMECFFKHVSQIVLKND